MSWIQEHTFRGNVLQVQRSMKTKAIRFCSRLYAQEFWPQWTNTISAKLNLHCLKFFLRRFTVLREQSSCSAFSLLDWRSKRPIRIFRIRLQRSLDSQCFSLDNKNVRDNLKRTTIQDERKLKQVQPEVGQGMCRAHSCPSIRPKKNDGHCNVFQGGHQQGRLSWRPSKVSDNPELPNAYTRCRLVCNEVAWFQARC